MTSATIKLFLPRGDAKRLRTAEISNRTDKAVAAPRTEVDDLQAREELDKAGVYVLIGSDPLTNAARAYIIAQRQQLIAEGTLMEKDGLLQLTGDAEFSSPSAAAVVIHGGSANGLVAWKTKYGKTLKQFDEQI